MSTCAEYSAAATDGVAVALQAVDCMANQATASAFNSLFGTSGALLPALTILLTLYIAFFAFALLTGRSRLGLSVLNRHAVTIGLVLTFATSWVAYQGVVWNLAAGAPDYLATVLIGSKGSATALFAQRIDILFAAIAQAASTVAIPEAGQAQVAAGVFSPATLLWIAAILLLLGTVGALITAKIALAVLMALGPVFIVLALFGGTRGLFVGWLRGTVMIAAAPLFAVLGGTFMTELAVPIVANINMFQAVDGRSAIALFVLACVHMALMFMVFRVLGQVVSAWSVFGLSSADHKSEAGRATVGPLQATGDRLAGTSPYSSRVSAPRSSALAAAATTHSPDAVQQDSSNRTVGRPSISPGSPSMRPGSATGSVRHGRARGIGSRYRARPQMASEILK